jgi:hypothetical protein
MFLPAGKPSQFPPVLLVHLCCVKLSCFIFISIGFCISGRPDYTFILSRTSSVMMIVCTCFLVVATFRFSKCFVSFRVDYLCGP